MKSGIRIIRHMLPDPPQIGQGTTGVLRDGRWEWAKCPAFLRLPPTVKLVELQKPSIEVTPLHRVGPDKWEYEIRFHRTNDRMRHGVLTDIRE